MGKLNTMLQTGRAFGVRGSMLRLQYEVQRGSGLLSRKMRSVQGWDSWDLKRIAPAINAASPVICPFSDRSPSTAASPRAGFKIRLPARAFLPASRGLECASLRPPAEI